MVSSRITKDNKAGYALGLDIWASIALGRKFKYLLPKHQYSIIQYNAKLKTLSHAINNNVFIWPSRAVCENAKCPTQSDWILNIYVFNSLSSCTYVKTAGSCSVIDLLWILYTWPREHSHLNEITSTESACDSNCVLLCAICEKGQLGNIPQFDLLIISACGIIVLFDDKSVIQPIICFHTDWNWSWVQKKKL